MKNITISCFSIIFTISLFSQTWVYKTAMPEGRDTGAITAYGSGIYIFGGRTSSSLGGTNSVLFYNINNNSWSYKASMSAAYYCRTAVTVGSSIYVISGTNYGGQGETNNVDIYTPSTNSWSSTTPIPTAREGFGAAYYNGNIYCFGGNNPSEGGILNSTEIFNISSETWSEGTDMPISGYTSAFTIGNKIYVIIHDEESYGAAIYNKLYSYDPNYNSFSYIRDFTPRNASTSTINDQCIICLGGNSVYGNSGLYLVEGYNVYYSQYATLNDAPDNLRVCAMSAGYDDKVYLIGGNEGSDHDNKTLTVLEGDFSDISLPVHLSNIECFSDNDKITIEWTVESEIDIMGYNILRKEYENDTYTKINNQLVESVGATNYRYTYKYLDTNVKIGTTYIYVIESVALAGLPILSNPIIVDFNFNSEIPTSFSLFENYPNPTNPGTWIPYQLSNDAYVKLDIYNIIGQKIKSYDIGYQRAGFYISPGKAIYWDCCDKFNRKVSTGIYIIELLANDIKLTNKIIVTY